MKSSDANQGSREVDDELLKICYEEAVKNIELAAIHLRDARNLLGAIKRLNDNHALSKAAILMATAALETNLTYLAYIALRFAEARPQLLAKPHVDFLRGVEQQIDDNGKLIEKRIKQSLLDRMQLVPDLLARTLNRRYEFPRHSAAAKKMLRTIERRDAIVHPRWDRNIQETGWWEAAEAVDAVELYLLSVYQRLHPYPLGYASMLWTIKGPTKHDVDVGYRTLGKRGPKRKRSSMEDRTIAETITSEWIDAAFMTELALTQATEGDSEGSVLTRAALVLSFAMVDAQLSITSQWRIHENPAAFHTAEILFLNEVAAGVGHDGEVWIDSDQHPFKKRIRAIPTILARCIDGRDFSLDLGKSWGQNLLRAYELRNRVVHSSPGQQLSRVTKEELQTAMNAIRGYFETLATEVPAFSHMKILLTKD